MLKLSTASHGLFATLFPVYVFSVLALGVLVLLLHLFAPKLERRLLEAAQHPAGVFLGIALFGGLYAALTLVVLSFPGFIDPGEPMIASISYFAVHGTQVYKMFIPYGPFCYFPYGLALRTLGASISTLKATVFIGNAVFIGLMYVLLRRYMRSRAALLAVTLVIAACMMKQVYVLQIRGDLFIYIAVVLAMLGATSRRASWAVALLTIALTLGIGVKITAILYLLYPCAIIWKRFGLRSLSIAGALTAILSLSPFVLPNLNLPDYMHWLHAMSGQLRSTKELAGNLLTSAILIFPCLLMYWQFRDRDPEAARQYFRDNRLLLGAFLLGLLAVDVLGSKFGAGRHHLIPFFILSACLVSDMYARMEESAHPVRLRTSIVFAWGALGLLLFVTEASELRDELHLTHVENTQAVALKQDVESIERQYAGEKIEVGNGRGLVDLDTRYSPQYAAPLLVFAGNAYTFDQSAQADRELMKMPMSASAIQYLRSCSTPVWLIPKGEVPFRTLSIYSDMYPKAYPNHLVFPEAFRQTFEQTYQHTATSQFFDIYTCRIQARM